MPSLSPSTNGRNTLPNGRHRDASGLLSEDGGSLRNVVDMQSRRDFPNIFYIYARF
jgi:hypothetical protein